MAVERRRWPWWATLFQPRAIVLAIAYALVPVAVAIGVLRYRLLGIELVSGAPCCTSR